ncbi:PREDICTED: protein KRTCAP2 homolog [Nicrophorus vespilloides]|uniref:Protein KRTCAP2 homolog n=1 Tax=Nicrophorus vespilloides TaxID=110193 RepID=A0ABM1MNV9_NICVS|nr:PREDICTED: protein KRTCAP2 homolog [Nicrophorus vespilloides]
MAMSSGISFTIALISAVLIFSGMQMYKPWLVSSQMHTILGGYLGSILFIFIVTACGNLGNVVFGKSMQVKLFPEVAFSLALAIFSTGSIHRVSATTCVLFSLVALYYINKHSQKVYATPITTNSAPSGKKRK